MAKLLTVVGLIALALLGLGVVMIVGALSNGFALSYLWLWFVVPLGVKPLGIAHAIGLGAIVRFLTHQYSSDSPGWSGFFVALLSPFIVLLFCYIIKAWM